MSVENRENRPPSRSAYPPGVKFEVQFADKKLNIAAPKRIVDLENSTRRDLSQELIDEKQRKAEERRKKEEQARLERIHQTEAEIKRFCDATSSIISGLSEENLRK